MTFAAASAGIVALSAAVDGGEFMQDVRWLGLEHMAEVAALEARCFPSAWTAQQFADAWWQDWFAGYGLFLGTELAGYITLSVLAGELEVLNIAVCPEQRGRGLSYPLMSYALHDTLQGGHLQKKGMPPAGWERGVLEVRTGNRPALALYARLGFVPAGLRRQYYADGEDALVMTLEASALPPMEKGTETVHPHLS